MGILVFAFKNAAVKKEQQASLGVQQLRPHLPMQEARI